MAESLVLDTYDWASYVYDKQIHWTMLLYRLQERDRHIMPEEFEPRFQIAVPMGTDEMELMKPGSGKYFPMNSTKKRKQGSKPVAKRCRKKGAPSAAAKPGATPAAVPAPMESRDGVNLDMGPTDDLVDQYAPDTDPVCTLIPNDVEALAAACQSSHGLSHIIRMPC